MQTSFFDYGRYAHRFSSVCRVCMCVGGAFMDVLCGVAMCVSCNVAVCGAFTCTRSWWCCTVLTWHGTTRHDTTCRVTTRYTPCTTQLNVRPPHTNTIHRSTCNCTYLHDNMSHCTTVHYDTRHDHATHDAMTRCDTTTR